MAKRSIAVLGAGRLAHSLAAALCSRGIKINCIYDRTSGKSARFAKQFSIPHYVSRLAELPSETTHFLVTVSDGALPLIASALQEQAFVSKERYFIHFSGVEDSRVFKNLKKRGVYTGSLHLLQSFPTTQIVSFENCGAALESASPKCISEMADLVKKLKAKPFVVKTENKTAYHLMGVILSNFLTGNLAAAQEIFNFCGIKNVTFEEIAKPIIVQTLQNALSQGIAASLSGPVERNAEKVLKKHIASLAERKELNHLLSFYIEQSRQLVRTASVKNPKTDYGDLREFLGNSSDSFTI